MAKLIQRRFKYGLLRSLLVLTLLTPFLSRGATTCPELLTQSREVNTEYSVLNKSPSAVRDQCTLGTCDLQAWASWLERDYLRRTGKRSLRISSDFMVARRWYQSSTQGIKNLYPNVDALGTYGAMNYEDILEYGLVPSKAWSAKSNFQSKSISAKIKKDLELVVDQVKAVRERNASSEEIQVAIDNARKKIDIIFDEYIGPFPEKFDFEGEQYTPQSFRKVYFPNLDGSLIEMREFHRNSLPYQREGFGYLEMSATSERMEQTARQLLDDGHNVMIAYYHKKYFVDNQSGVMRISELGSGPEHDAILSEYYDSPSARRDAYRQSSTHAVVIVGYDADPVTNKIIKWKIKNSWGTKNGDKGYYHMYNDYFHKFISALFVFEEDLRELQ